MRAIDQSPLTRLAIIFASDRGLRPSALPTAKFRSPLRGSARRDIRSIKISWLLNTAFRLPPYFSVFKISIALSAIFIKCGCERLPLVRIAKPRRRVRFPRRNAV